MTTTTPETAEDETANKEETSSPPSTKGDDMEMSKDTTFENEPTIRESFMTRLYLTSNFAFQVPFYTICFCLIVYGTLLMWAGSNRWLFTLLLLYAPYCALGLDKSPTTGSTWLSYSTIEWFRSWRCFRDAARYLRLRLVKTHELDPKHAHIFAYHPHGIISMGANAALSTNGCGFPSVFPGIHRWGVTLHQIFMVPFYREWLLSIGFLVADKQTLEKKLRDGDSIVLIPGGAAEALYATSERMVLYLSNRRGFIKLAMETGAAIVPCIGFGENDVFHTFVPSAGFLQKLTHKIRRFTRFSTPIMTWPIPKRPKVAIVVGKPIFFPQGSNADENHKVYVKALRDLYESHQAQYGYANIPLEII